LNFEGSVCLVEQNFAGRKTTPKAWEFFSYHKGV
jgi:hypothetical protein